MKKNQTIESKLMDNNDISNLLSERVTTINKLRKYKRKQLYEKIINLEIYIDQANISLESTHKLEDLRYLGCKLMQNMKDDKIIIEKLKVKIRKIKSSGEFSAYDYINKLLDVLEDKYEYIYESYSENYNYEVENAFNSNYSGTYINMEEDIRNYKDKEKEISLNLHLQGK